MRRYEVVSDWKVSYADPIVLTKNEELWLSGKTDSWEGHIWVWAKNQAGKEGWIPDTLIENQAGRYFANNLFSAMELTCHIGQELTFIDETHGWVLCKAKDGSQGWVPAKNLKVI
jgi:uncharacterized protein YgiM (DUF1202 family)